MLKWRQEQPRDSRFCTNQNGLPIEPPVSAQGMVWNLYAALVEEHKKNCEVCAQAGLYSGICDDLLFFFNDYSALIQYIKRPDEPIEVMRQKYEKQHRKYREKLKA